MNYLAIMLQAEGAAPAGGGYSFLIMMVVLFGVIYLFMIRPQQKKQKELNKFRQSLRSGDKVITAGGIYGTIKDIRDNYVIIEVDNGVSIRVDKSMIMRDMTDVPQQR